MKTADLFKNVNVVGLVFDKDTSGSINGELWE
jgi:hypothetical protein